MKIKSLILNKVSGLVMLLASSATVLGCSLVFHEVEVPESLKKQVRF